MRDHCRGSAIATGAVTATSPPTRLVLCVLAEQSRLPPAAMGPLITSVRERLARKLSQDGTPVVVVPADVAAAEPRPGSVLARIVLTDVRAGNQALRLAIGFGAGRAVLEIHTSLVDLRGARPVELATWDTRSTTGRCPDPCSA